MGTRGLVWSRMHGDVQDAWQAGVVVCSRQSDKVKPLPCTLTEVFHATAAWRQNPTKTAGITFQTGMPVDNVRPPVISITIIRGDLGLHQPCTSVPTSFLPPPTPPLPLRGLDDLSTRRANPSCHHQHILPVRTVVHVLSSPVRSRPSPESKANLNRVMHNGCLYGHYVCVWVCGCVKCYPKS